MPPFEVDMEDTLTPKMDDWISGFVVIFAKGLSLVSSEEVKLFAEEYCKFY